MKRIFFLFFVFLFSFSGNVFSQKKNNLEIFYNAEKLMQENKFEDSNLLFKDLYSKMEEKDTLKNYVTWYYLQTSSILEKENGMDQKYDKELIYALEALHLIQNNKKYFNEEFASREPWMIKNVILAYSGLNNFEKAKEYKSMLYSLYNEKKLPEGIDGFFNFDFFRLGDKNIWGYEWYPELPENRFSSSFTKVVYYVYDTNPDGSDKDQLYRFHVLMFHKEPKEGSFDYILEKHTEKDGADISGTYYQYTYNKEIDYKKLRNDIIEIISKDKYPDTKRIIQNK